MERAFLLRVSYVEIYNETLRDLLNFDKGSKETPVIHTGKVSRP
jgi:centromeric protein E